MPATTVTETGTLFPEELIPNLINLVRGHSTLAKLCAQKPMPQSGEKEFIFTMDDEAEIVPEGGTKSAGDAKIAPVTCAPVKFVYQHRVSDEFDYCAKEKKIKYLEAFTEGFAKKIARGFDIAAFHEVNPRTGNAAQIITGKGFTSQIPAANVVTWDADAPDACLEDAIELLRAAENDPTGIAMSYTFASGMGKMRNGLDAAMYPEFRFGATPERFAGKLCDANSTMTYATPNNKRTHLIVGDFANCFRWGYAERIPMEIIRYGDPDGVGTDLKRVNQICLRAEAYIGWGILNPAAFAAVRETVS